MSSILHIPALPRGKAYKSLDKTEVKDFRTGEVKATVSKVNAGIVREDVQCVADPRAALNKITVAQLIEICSKAGLKQIGPSLVVTAITRDPAWPQALLAYPHIERLNLGPISTMKISRDQPHEGNMFEFLWKRRAFESAGPRPFAD